MATKNNGESNVSYSKKRKSDVCNSSDESDKNWPRFIVISAKDKDKNVNDLSPFLIQKTIKGVAGDVKDTKKIRSGILIECLRPGQSSNLLKLTRIGDLDVVSSAHKSLNQSQGVLKYRGRDLDALTDEEICEELKSQGVKSVKRFTSRRADATTPMRTILLTFSSTSVPSHVYIGPYRTAVSLYIPNPLRCFKCQKFGHGKGQCRGKLFCFRCSEEGHEGIDCKKRSEMQKL